MRHSDRRHGLDLLRVLAALGVMVAHFLAHLHLYAGVSLERVDRWNFVDFFFVLSGFVLAEAYAGKVGRPAGYYDFLWTRFARLYPLHAATILALILVGFAAALVGYPVRVPDGFDPRLAPQNLLLLHAWNVTSGPSLNSPSWSLSAEAFLLLLFPALVALSARLRIATSVVLIGAFAAALHVWRARAGMTPWTEATWDFGALRALPTFFAGIVVFRFVEARPGWRTPGAVTALFGAATLALIFADAPQELTVAAFPFLLLCAATTDFGALGRSAGMRAVRMFSELTFGTFLLHTFTGLAVVQAARFMGSPGLLTISAMIVAACAATFAFAWLVNRHFEAPMRQWLRRRGPPALLSSRETETSGLAASAAAHVYLVPAGAVVFILAGMRIASALTN